MESTRFPGKVVAPILGQPMLLWQLTRLQHLQHLQSGQIMLRVALANTPETRQTLEPLLSRHGYLWQTPDVPPEDVLGRFARICEENPACTHLVRLTGDCPLIDPQIIAQGIEVASIMPDTLICQAPEWPDGTDFDVIPVPMLLEAHENATLASDREHVTPWLWKNGYAEYRLPCPLDCSDQLWSVDTPDDGLFAQNVYAELLPRHGVDFTWLHVYGLVQTASWIWPWTTKWAERKRNAAYLQQIGTEQDWKTVRFGDRC